MYLHPPSKFKIYNDISVRVVSSLLAQRARADQNLLSRPISGPKSKIDSIFYISQTGRLFVCCLFVCLFVCFSSHSRIFHLNGDVTIAGEGLQILTNARHSWPLSKEGSLACHSSEAVTTCIYDYKGRGWYSNTQHSVRGTNALTHCATAAVLNMTSNNTDNH